MSLYPPPWREVSQEHQHSGPCGSPLPKVMQSPIQSPVPAVHSKKEGCFKCHKSSRGYHCREGRGLQYAFKNSPESTHFHEESLDAVHPTSPSMPHQPPSGTHHASSPTKNDCHLPSPPQEPMDWPLQGSPTPPGKPIGIAKEMEFQNTLPTMEKMRSYHKTRIFSNTQARHPTTPDEFSEFLLYRMRDMCKCGDARAFTCER